MIEAKDDNWLTDSFRHPELSQAVIKQIRPLAQKWRIKLGRPLQIMEVCGGHTHTLFRYGIPQLFKQDIEFVHGPGCPVCVLPREVIDHCVNWAQQDNVVIATFGDAIRVPGTQKSLQQARAEGADIRTVYSPLDALNLANQLPEKQVIFLALGFDTTMPSTALTLLQAEQQKCPNFSVYAVHITIIPTLKAVLAQSDIVLDGLIGPGHVSMVIGSQPYEFIAQEHNLPFVIAGFEPLDLLQSLLLVLRQIDAKEQGQAARVENQYSRTVLPQGNANALKAMSQVYEAKARSFWQGLGSQEHAGVNLTSRFRGFDAELRFSDHSQTNINQQNELSSLRKSNPVYCDDVIMGKLSPSQCPNFGSSCTPEHPQGALMVSSEGACAAWHQYNNPMVKEA